MSSGGYATQRLTAINAAIATLEAEVAVIQGQITSLQASVTSNTLAIAVLQGQVTTIQGQITTLQGQVTTINGNITTIQGQISTIQGQITTIQGQITTLQGQSYTTTKISLSNAQVLTLGTALQILPTFGVNNGFDLQAIYMRLNFVTASFLVNTNIGFFFNPSMSLAATIGANANILTSTKTRIGLVQLAGISTNNLDQYQTNQGLFVGVPTGNPTNGIGGLSTIDIWVVARKMDFS